MCKENGSQNLIVLVLSLVASLITEDSVKHNFEIDCLNAINR